jgi:GcrA cell cycle regulator
MLQAQWADDRVDKLKSLWTEGLTASQVATSMGNVSRNAVIGKLHRLGLLGGSAPASRLRPRTMPKPRAPNVPRTLAVVAEPEAFRFDDGAAVTPRSLEKQMCRWPLGDPRAGDFHFCGHGLKTGSPYCEAHDLRAHRPHRKAARHA